MASRRIAVCLETTPKMSFASALDWPGWCRAGLDEGAALQALASYSERYARWPSRPGSASQPQSPSMSSSGCPAGRQTRLPHPNAGARSRK